MSLTIIPMAKVSKPFIDKLSVVLNINTATEQNSIIANLMKLKEDGYEPVGKANAGGLLTGSRHANKGRG